jgi:hypothetical protein
MMGNDKGEPNAKATRGGRPQLYTMTEKELKKKLAGRVLETAHRLLTRRTH